MIPQTFTVGVLERPTNCIAYRTRTGFFAVSLFIPMRSQLKALLRNARLTEKYSFRNSSSLQKMVQQFTKHGVTIFFVELGANHAQSIAPVNSSSVLLPCSHQNGIRRILET